MSQDRGIFFFYLYGPSYRSSVPTSASDRMAHSNWSRDHRSLRSR